jgi:hypothetical protein
MITKIGIIVYLSLSLALILYTYVQYKMTFANEFANDTVGYDLTQSKLLDILERNGVKVDRFRKVMKILKNYYIEITVILALCSFIMLLYLSANMFGNVNIIARLLVVLLTGLLTAYSVYIYFLIKEYNNLVSMVINNETAELILQEEELLGYYVMKAVLDNITKYAIGYMAVSAIMTLTALGGLVFGL